MNKLKVNNLEGEETGSEIDVPIHFKEHVRPDIIKKAVKSIQSHNKQPYGSDPKAGMKHVAYWSKRRRDYRSLMGKSYPSSRTPRKVTFRRGMQINGAGAVAPQTRGGRKVHSPKPEKKQSKEINDKERKKAIRSAISATRSKERVKERGHILGEDIELPLVLSNDLEEIKKTNELKDTLKNLGLEKELERAKEKKIRSGKGKMRGRKYRRKVGPLLVIDNNKGIKKAASNLAGVEAVRVKNLNAEILAPGGNEGRLVIWSENAMEKIKEEELFR